jgi:4-amino-4-deoxy-L-arabinose transferase-like glycosyltransferase
MKSIWQKLHKIGDFLHLPDLPAWVLGILALVLILRIPSFFEPYYYGDEMIYLTLGQGVRQGLTLYKDIYDNKPPLLYLTAAAAGNLFWFKAILCFWSIITIIFFYKLAEKLFTKRKIVQIVSTSIFAILTTIPLFEGNIVNAELFMIGFTIVALYILLSGKLNSKRIYFAGLLFGLGTLFKVPAAFDVPVIVIYWLITSDFKNWKRVIKDTFILALGFVTPVLLTFIYFYFKGALPAYINAAFLQNVGYLSSFRPGDIQKPFYIRNGPLLIRAGIVFAGIVILYLSRKKLSKNFILFTIWTLLGLFAVTLSERPYPHYFVQIIAPISFFFGMFFAERSIEQALVVIPLAVSFFVPVYYGFYHYSTISYYTRFINFATGKLTKSEYLESFSSTVNRNYAIANFLTTSSLPSDKVFMWDSDSAVVYALSRRLPPIKFVADYHVNDYSSLSATAGQIIANPPKFIILTSNHPYPNLTPLIKNKYFLINQIGNADIYSRVDLAPKDR